MNNPPSLAMNKWILNSEAPWGFTIDEDAELRSVDEQRSIVKFTRHQVDSDDVRHQIEQGRQCVRLGLTWHERISFVLTDTIHLRKVEPLDVLVEQKNQSLDIGSDAFEVEFTLMTGELVNLLSDLVEALGGEKQI